MPVTRVCDLVICVQHSELCMSTNRDDSRITRDPYQDWIEEYFPLLDAQDHDDVVREMDSLVACAASDSEESKTARELLGHLVITRVSAEVGQEDHYISRVAARALLRLSYDENLRDSVYPSVRTILAYCPLLPIDVRLVMLDCLEAFA